MDILCCCLEGLGIYYLCRMCSQQRQQRQQQQQQIPAYQVQAPNRNTMAQPATVVRGPARYERTANVLGSRETSAPPTPYGQRATSQGGNIYQQPRPPSEPKKGTTASLNNQNGTSSSSNTYMPATTGYRLGDSAPMVQTSQGYVSDAPPSYQHALAHTNGNSTSNTNINHHVVQVDPPTDPSNMTLSEQVAIMPAASITLIKKILANAIDSPDSESDSASKADKSRRKIKLSNPKVQQQIVYTAGAMDILQSSGFTVVDLMDDGTNAISKFLFLPPGSSKQPLLDALRHLNEVRSDVPYVAPTTVGL